MLYDCIIVGGGPAGAVCSKLLSDQGYKCAILEKRPIIDEKICGGFVPNRCRELILQCGFDLSEMNPYGNRINGYVEIRDGVDKEFLYKQNRFGLGVYRTNLDSFMLNKTIEAGTTVLFGKKVQSYKMENNHFQVGEVEGKYLVWATGANPPLYSPGFDREKVHKIAQSQSVGISEIISVNDSKLQNDRVYFWYTGIDHDYFWAIPIERQIWNIGFWSQKNRKTVKTSFISGRKKWIEDSCDEIYTLRTPKGALLGNADFSECIIDNSVLCCGDLAGTNNIYTGEGIAQAVQSAQYTANKIKNLLKGGNL